jgi:menaquinone-dependent protoporphyrinogen IX oxidase
MESHLVLAELIYVDTHDEANTQFLQEYKHVLKTHPVSYSVGTLGSFPGGK